MTGLTASHRRLLIALVPALAFAGLAILFFIALRDGGDPATVPSALIDSPAPEFELPPVEGLDGPAGAVPGLATADLKRGQVSIVNVWASWCGPCRVEHPLLMELAARDDIVMSAINYKDEPENARRFLGQLGNPFAAVGADGTGRTAVDWGVYGVPETFIVDGTGTIRHKHVGPLTEQSLAEQILPAIAAAGAK